MNAPAEIQKPQAQQYLDYREYLKEWCAWRREKDDAFSQRGFAKEAGLPASSSSLLPAVMNGRRNLSQGLRIKFAKALKLNERDAAYFDLLVQFNQAKGMPEKNHFFGLLSKFRTSRARILSDSQMEFFSSWQHSAVRNYFGMETKQNRPEVIGSKLLPPLNANQVQSSIQLLQDLGLIKKTANGFTVSDKHIFTPKDVQAKAANEHLRELTRMSMEVMNQVPAENRQYNALMFTISPQGFQNVKDRMRSFLEELREIIDKDQNEDRIYTLTMQLFPNSQLARDGESGGPGGKAILPKG